MGAVWVFILTVLIFGVLIFVHELGHFLACRLFGVRVNEFAIGMGPKLFSKKSEKSGTLYSVRAIPIGGFNSIEDGTEERVDDEGLIVFHNPPKEELPEYAFGAKPVWQRMIIILAGAFMNIVLGFLIMTVVVISSERYASTNIAYFVEYEGETEIKLEEFSGIKAGDKVIKVGNRRVFTGDELIYSIFAKGTDPVDVTVIRDGKKTVIKDVEFPTTTQDGVLFGVINFRIYTEEKNFVNTAKQAFFGSINVVTQVFDSIAGMFTGKYGLEHISGPIGVGQVIGQAAQIGLSSVLTITVMLTMNLGVCNLFPIPGLDGGKFIFLLIEAIIRRPIPRKVEEYSTAIGISILMLLIIVVAFKDTFTLIFK